MAIERTSRTKLDRYIESTNIWLLENLERSILNIVNKLFIGVKLVCNCNQDIYHNTNEIGNIKQLK